MNSMISAAPVKDAINPATICTKPLCESRRYTGSVSSLSPATIYIKPCFLEEALKWFDFGFKVIPIVPGTKRPAVKHEPWLSELSPQTIKDHWSKHPDHEVGCIVGDDMIVFDADTPESIKALKNIEEFHNVKPTLVSKTQKGEHHFFRISPKTYVKSDSHDSKKHPKRIDIKTGSGMIVLPPSTGKTVSVKEAMSVNDLVTVDQTFIDSVFLMNDREVPRPPEPMVSPRVNSTGHETIIELLNHIDPDLGYEDWLHVLMAVFHETGGSDEGLEIVDAWSRKGQKYKGLKEIETKWRSFKQDVATPYTRGTLIKMAKGAGADVGKESFEVCETIVIPQVDAIPSETPVVEEINPFDKFSMTGMSEELERDALEQVPVIGEIALRGQLTVICAEGGTGKTLLIYKLLTESIAAKRINPSKVYYLNMDDDFTGLVVKLKIAEEYGFNMLAEGQKGFKISDFQKEIEIMVRDNNASGVIIILDTLKKFVDPMKKSECREFNTLLRQFSTKGGTVIALAHTNKHKGADGKLIFAGVGDLRDDFDCMYLLNIEPERNSTERIVTFQRDKSRGAVVNKVSYRYLSGESISYNEMFLSVEKVDDAEVTSLQQSEALRSDAEVIDAALSCIKEGKNTKMLLAEAAAVRSGASKRAVSIIIEKYTGDDPTQHRWNFVRGERGKQIYSALELSPMP